MKDIIKSVIILIFISTNLLIAQEKIVFKTLSNMNEKRFGFGSVTDGKYLYAVCGGIAFSPYYSDNIERYDTENNKWTNIAKTSTLRRYCNAEYIESVNKIYIMNGEYQTPSFNTLSKKVEVLDLNTNLVSLCAENPNPLKNAGSAVWNNKIYIFGGQNLYGYSNDFFEYDPANDTWKKLPDLPERKQTSGKIVDGVLYIFGGNNGKRNYDDVYAYNFQESTWTQLEDLPFEISANSSAVSDGRSIWLLGSFMDTGLLAVYNTKTKTISKYDSNMNGRQYAGVQIIGEKLYLFGGSKNTNAISALSNTEYTNIADQKK